MATKGFDLDKDGEVVAGIYDCEATKTDCNLLASGSASFSQSTFGGDFGMVTIVMPSIDIDLGASRGLMLTIATPNSSGDHLWFAYDAAGYESALTIS